MDGALWRRLAGVGSFKQAPKSGSEDESRAPFEEVVGILSKKLGKEIKHEELPYDALTFLPPFLQELFLYMGQKGEAAVPFSEDTMKLCGEHTTFESWLDDGFVNAFKA